jgi:hypothetical protein
MNLGYKISSSLSTKFRCYLLFLSLSSLFSPLFIRIMSTRWEINYFFTISKTYVSHKMLHHAKPKLLFCLMHMFELFDFVFMVCLNLNSKQKNKKILEIQDKKEKGKQSEPSSLLGLSAHPAQLTAHTHLRPLTGGPHLSASRSACSLAFSLCPVGPPHQCCCSLARTRSRWLAGPAHQTRPLTPQPSCPRPHDPPTSIECLGEDPAPA